MDAFIRSQVQGLNRRRAPMPRPAQCMLVKRVAARSVAGHAGVAAKDLLVAVDGTAAAELSPDLYLLPRSRHRAYSFYGRAAHELIELSATGIEIGVELTPTVDAIRARYEPARPDYKALEALWEARQSAALESLASATLAQTRERGTPALLYRGAALFDEAREAEAMELIDEYANKYASWWTMNFTAVALYYQGAHALSRGDKETALGLLETAFGYNAFDRIAQALEKLTGRRPEPPAPRWPGQRFPLDYALPDLDGGTGPVSLSPTLATLRPGQLLVVCLLDGYRGNGPYNQFMRRYLNYATYFGDYLHGLHVITEQRERPAERPYYFRGEDAVRDARLPMRVLFDADGLAAAAVQAHRSPLILLIEPSATVVYEGDLESVDLWEALGRRAMPLPA